LLQVFYFQKNNKNVSFFTSSSNGWFNESNVITSIIWSFFDVGFNDLPLLSSGSSSIDQGGNQLQQGQGQGGTPQNQLQSGDSGTSLTVPHSQQHQLSTFLKPELIRVDIHESNEEYGITCEIPGVPKENVKVTVDNGYLSISGNKQEEKHDEKQIQGRKIRRQERRFGEFSRSFRLPSTVDQHKVQAKFENGILNVSIPKTEIAKSETRQIQIQ